jgi:hypothetical protein
LRLGAALVSAETFLPGGTARIRYTFLALLAADRLPLARFSWPRAARPIVQARAFRATAFVSATDRFVRSRRTAQRFISAGRPLAAGQLSFFQITGSAERAALVTTALVVDVCRTAIWSAARLSCRTSLPSSATLVARLQTLGATATVAFLATDRCARAGSFWRAALIADADLIALALLLAVTSLIIAEFARVTLFGHADVLVRVARLAESAKHADPRRAAIAAESSACPRAVRIAATRDWFAAGDIFRTRKPPGESTAGVVMEIALVKPRVAGSRPKDSAKSVKEFAQPPPE